MSSNTPNLGLLKKDPMVDGNETFNIETMLNENWDKIDEAVGNVQVEIPDSSTTQKGIVQLSNATDGTRENVAATEKAVKDAALQAKSYTDQQISLVTETGIPKLVSYPLLVTATADNQKVFEIPLDLFDANTDTLLIAINRAALDPTQYTVTNTVRNEAGEVTQRAKITLLSGVASTSELAMVVLKNVPLGEDGAINGAVLSVDSIPINRVNGLEDQLREAFQAGNERKAEVVAALVAIGVPATTGETWAQLIPKISAIIRALGDATAADVLAGKKFSNLTGNNLTGTIPNRGAGGTITPGTSNITMQAGYYSSDIIIRGEPNKIPGNIRKGVSIDGVDGSLSPGSRTIVNINPTDYSPITSAINTNGTTLLYTFPAGYNFIDFYSDSTPNAWYSGRAGIITITRSNVNTALSISAGVELWDQNNVRIQSMPNWITMTVYNQSRIVSELSGLSIDRASRTIRCTFGNEPWTPPNVIPSNFDFNGPIRLFTGYRRGTNESASFMGRMQGVLILT
ncbi:hypothetical protein J28TS4_37560 [Paenibacillus lautus]|uniref:phage tail protein n=1 Tax=Paenibacillus lautus TaxID=1401 RepID=UPI001B155668|nr:phage tail protein [Paenibacillus lautus]GIP05349.1 hypothetical protein J28TS4_37560 [Paenibacillus lautus]